MEVLPFVIALITARALAPAVLGLLRARGVVRDDASGRSLPYPLGVLVVLGALLALIPVALLERLDVADAYPDDLALVMLFVPAMALIGFLADTLGRPPAGVADPAPVALRTLTLGATVGLGLVAASYLPGSNTDFLVAAAVLVLAEHVFSELDVRPGLSAKAFVLLGAGLLIATQDTGPAATVGVFAGPVLVAAWYDLRGQGLLGASGASVIGALAGLWLVLALSPGEQVVALLVLLALAIFERVRSISAAVGKLPGLRHLDSLGRPS